MDAPGGVPSRCSPADRAPEPGPGRRRAVPRPGGLADPRDDRRGRRRELRSAPDPDRRRLPRGAHRRGVRDRAAHLLDVDDDAEVAFFAVESREESVMTAVRVHLPTRATESLWQSTYGAYVAAWTPDLSRIVLADGYTIGDVVLYEIDDAGARRCSSERRSRSATRTRGPPRVPSQPRHGERRRAAPADDVVRGQRLARIPRPVAARRVRARRARRSRPRG